MTEDKMRAAISEAVSDGIRDVMTDPEALGRFWDAAFEQIQSRAQIHTGRFLLSGLSTIARRAMMFLALGLLVYALGGWSALVKLWQVLNN